MSEENTKNSGESADEEVRGEESGPTIDDAPCGLGAALREQGFKALTPIQAAVVDAEAKGRDLRLTSQTGSGKTVAVGLAMAEQVANAGQGRRGLATPAALVIAPTRELANQLARELRWLYRPLNRRVSVVTGGTNVLAEKSELRKGPHVLVGTPGRLLDHLRHDAASLEELQVVVLDEADEMLDMGFEDELNAILDFAPESRRTHLVSATFSGEALRLAKKLQKDDALAIEGTPLGEANSDIDHRCVLVHLSDRLDVIINLLLRFPEDKTLIFVRTRMGALELARRLSDLDFSALPLSGEMSQRERTDAFERFRRGNARVLVATDVAARGVDVHDITMVIQADIPDDSEVFTHRSGRTGRAGRKGRNVMLVSPRYRRRVDSMLSRARVDADYLNAPRPSQIYEAADERLVAEFEGLDDESTMPRLRALASRLLEGQDPELVVAHLLTNVNHVGPTEPRRIKDLKADRGERTRQDGFKRGKRDRHERDEGGPRKRSKGPSGPFVPFQVSWGEERGADPRRLLAVACRRGGVSREDVGKIRVGPRSSMVEVSEARAKDFEAAASQPDPKDKGVHFRRWQSSRPEGDDTGTSGDDQPFKKKGKKSFDKKGKKPFGKKKGFGKKGFGKKGFGKKGFGKKFGKKKSKDS